MLIDEIERQFLTDIGEHQLSILRDDGVYRHLRFKKPSTSCMYFDLISWPGNLCYTGDMGTYVFRRLPDMFEFFRSNSAGSGAMRAINPGYWAEKLQAPSPRDAQVYSADAFRRQVKDSFDSWVVSCQPNAADCPSQAQLDQFVEQKDNLWESLVAEVLSVADAGELEVHHAARDFSCEAAPCFSLADSWEWACREFKPDFIWCCYALVWGIKQYDEADRGAPRG